MKVSEIYGNIAENINKDVPEHCNIHARAKSKNLILTVGGYEVIFGSDGRIVGASNQGIKD